VHLALVLKQTGQHDAAVRVLEKGLRQAPKDPMLLLSLARVLLGSTGQPTQRTLDALSYAQRAATFADATLKEQALETLALAYAEVGASEEATRTAQQLAAIYEGRGDHDRARQILTRFSDLSVHRGQESR